MNKWFAIRILIVLLGFLSPIYAPVTFYSNPPMTIKGLLLITFATPFGLLFILGIQAFNPRSAPHWDKPSWHSNPFNFKQPLQFFHLGAFHFLASGISSSLMIPFTGVKYLYESLVPFAIGIGLFLGIQISIWIFQNKMCTSYNQSFNPDL